MRILFKILLKVDSKMTLKNDQNVAVINYRKWGLKNDQI
jgi:hypothetical protein